MKHLPRGWHRTLLAEVLATGKLALIEELQEGGASSCDDRRRHQRRAGTRNGRRRHRDGSRTDIAMQTADVTLSTSNLQALVDAVRLSRRTMLTIRQNLFFALVYNRVGIPRQRVCSIRGWELCSRRCSPPPRWHSAVCPSCRTACGRSGFSGTVNKPESSMNQRGAKLWMPSSLAWCRIINWRGDRPSCSRSGCLAGRNRLDR